MVTLRSSTITYCLCALVLLAVASCGPVVKQGITPSAQLNTQARVSPAPDYLIQPGDELEIKFQYNPELNEKLPVRPDGRISLPIVKEVAVVGLSPAKCEEMLTEKYRPELKKPEVTVIVRTFTNQKVFVDGEVYRAGLVPLTGPLTVMQAIAQAGGMRDTARRSQVLVIRQNGDGPFFTSVLDLRKAIDGTDRSQDIALMPYDVVYIPKSAIANVNLFVEQYVSRNIPSMAWYALPYVAPIPTR